MVELCQFILPQLVMAVVDMAVVICEPTQPSTNKTQSLPNLKGLQAHYGKSPLKAMTSLAEGKPRTKLLCLRLFILKS